MKQYLELLHKIESKGRWKPTRTGIRAKSVSGFMFEHDMQEGFPLVTVKNTSLKMIAIELNGFLHGISSKSWFSSRGCNIWNQWCNPRKVPYGTDAETQAKMLVEDDLGRIYGVQWRDFGGRDEKDADGNVVHIPGIDQLKKVVDKLKSDPFDRRMIVSAWNPLDFDQMALPPCHDFWQVLSDGIHLDLQWHQRSVDSCLGIGFNIASYGLLLELLAKESNLKPGILTGFLADCHYYENQSEGLKELLTRSPAPLPRLEIPDFTSIFDWTYEQRKLIGYKPGPKIEFPIAI